MELIGKIINDINIAWQTNKARITFEIEGKDNAVKVWDKLHLCDKLRLEVKKYYEKRSLDANAYLWVLVGKIADRINASKDEVYLTMLKRYGQGGVVKVRPEDEETILKAIKYYEPHERLYGEGKYYRVWAGSSGYNTFEMSKLIDGVVSEAKELGIETATPEEIAKMKALWDEERKQDEKHNAV